MYQSTRNPPNVELVKFLFKLLPLFLVFLHACYALYEDQIGKFDWRQQYIGKVKFSYIDPSVAGTHKFHLATEENVLSCVSTRTGSIIWRQVLENGVDGTIDALSEEGEMITVSGQGRFIRSWDLNTGVLLWETTFPNIDFKSNSVFKFYIDTVEKEIILVEIQKKSYAKVYIYSFTRATMKTSDLIIAPSVDPSDCTFLSSQYFLCLEKRKFLNLLSIKDSGSFMTVPLSNFHIEKPENAVSMQIVPIPYQKSSDKPFFALQMDDFVIVFQIQPPGITIQKMYARTYGVTATVIDNALVLFLLMRNNGEFNVVPIDANSNEILKDLRGKFKCPVVNGKTEKFYILPYIKRDQATSYKILLSTEDHMIQLIHQQSRVIWSREEALANIIAVEILDLPLSETDANIEQEFSDAEASLLGMFITRLKSQLYVLENLYHQSMIDLHHTTNGIMGNSDIDLSRDTFGLHKIIIAVTKPGKIYGIDNLSGQIIWSHYEKELLPLESNDQYYYSVFVQRTTAHIPYPPLCTVIGKHRNSNQSHLLSFNPITGKTIDSKMLPYNVIQTLTLGTMDQQYMRGIVLLDSELNVHAYPSSMNSVLLEHKNTHYVVVANSDQGTITGYTFRNSDVTSLLVSEIWRMKFPNRIVHVALKRPLEHVHSQGRVMGDRSVLYKYLNPNLAAVFTEGNDPIHKSLCNVHLIDTITGLIVYSVSHKKCRQPIKVVHSENWIVYSYYNDKSRRVEVSSIELFEGMYQSNTTAFSSFAPPPLPLVEHQTFIFPSPIETMIDTVTERGMTNKHILIALPTGGILELPKSFLDPRRPINPTPEHREEGLIPYVPELPIMSDKIINYNQSVMRVHGVQTAPSGLESTCLVFAYGLDLFYTRVTPSKTFDILKDDFDHYLISAVLLGLLLLSYTTKRLAARKSLKAAWK